MPNIADAFGAGLRARQAAGSARSAQQTAAHAGNSVTADSDDPAIERGASAAPPESRVDELVELARASADASGWDPEAPLSEGRNAHHTNRAAEMEQSIRSDYNWLEGDLRIANDGTLVMAHDPHERADGLTLEQWLRIGAASQRGLKIDVKEQGAIPEMVDAVKAAGVHGGRLMLNVAVQLEGQDTGLQLAQMRELRAQFPNAWIAINPSDFDEYSPKAINAMVEAAEAVGGRVTFPLQWDLATDEVIAQLKPHGRISIWTYQAYATPADPGAETRQLRERGVDGVIDLGTADWFTQHIGQPALRGAAKLFGREAVGEAVVVGEASLRDATSGWGLLAGALTPLGIGMPTYAIARNSKDIAEVLWKGTRHAGDEILETLADTGASLGDALDDVPIIGRLF